MRIDAALWRECWRLVPQEMALFCGELLLCVLAAAVLIGAIMYGGFQE